MKSGHVTIMKIENLHIDIRRNFNYSKMLSFSIYDENNKVIMEKPFQNSGVTRRLWRFQHATVLEGSIEVGLSLILSIHNVVYTSMKDLHARFVVKLVKMCGFGLVEMALVMMFSRP